MLKNELNNLRYYIAEKERLNKEIASFKEKISDGYQSPEFGVDAIKPKNKINDQTISVVKNNIKYQALIEKRAKKLEVIILKLYKLINKIENQEIKAIVELRNIKGLTWREIGEEINLEESTCRKKYNNYINS